jgi:phosphatidylethanolamine/phosphatidyl-N-methylethanolamine N-methyltransferase
MGSVTNNNAGGGENRVSIKDKDVIRTYKRYAPLYDATFGKVVGMYHRHLGARMCESGAKSILEIGVGTGLALPHYPKGSKVIGVDLSDAMLDIARARVARGVQADVELRCVDGERLPFDDATFDAVTLPFVVSVAPNPDQLLAEARRVVKPGGSVVILNHFAGVNGLKWLEAITAPLAKWIGFRSDFKLDDALRLAAMDVYAVKPLAPVGFFTLVHLTRPQSA